QGLGGDRVVGGVHPLLDRPLGGPLHLGVERGLDRQAAPVEELGALLLGLAEDRVVEDLGSYVHAVVRVGAGAAAAGQRGALVAELLGLGLLQLGVGDLAELVHPVEHDVAPLQQALAVLPAEVRVGAVRVLYGSGVGGGLGQVDVLGRDADEPLGGGLHAVRARPDVGE